MMGKKLQAIVLALLIICAALLTACADREKLSFQSDEFTLMRYEELQLELNYDGGKEVEYTSSDTAVVTVSDTGYMSAQGTGSAVVTAKAGGRRATGKVTVRDDGSKPFITGSNVSVMKGKTFSSAFYVVYNDKTVTGAELAFDVSNESVATVSESGDVTGVSIGQTQVEVTGSYKGLALVKKTYTITVTENTFIDISDSLDLFLIDSGYVSRTAEINPDIYVGGDKVDQPQLTLTLLSGQDYVTLTGTTVEAQAVGQAVLKIDYAAGTLIKEVTINVFDNYRELNDDFYYSGVWGAGYAPYGGTDSEFAGSYVYTTGETNGSGPWDWHLSSKMTETEGEFGFKTQELMESGYKYFTYTLYYTGSSRVYLGIGDNSFWVPVNSGIRKDFVYLITDGKVTNRLTANTWITMVINLERALTAGEKCDLFVLTEEAEETTYIKNVRYYYNRDGLLPEDYEEPVEDIVVYTQMDGYVQATNNDFILAGTTETYMPYEYTIDGVSGAYLYKNGGSNWWDGRLCLSASYYDKYLVRSYENLKEKSLGADWVTFDIWYSGSAGIHVGIAGGINDVGPMLAQLNGGLTFFGLDTTKYVYILEDGEITDKFVANRWITIAINFELVGDPGVVSELYIGLDEVGSAFAFIDNIRYYKDADFNPETAAEEAPDTLAAYKQMQNSELFVEPEEGATLATYEAHNKNVGEMSGTFKYTANSNADWWNKLQFKSVHGSAYGDDWAKIGDYITENSFTHAVFNIYLTGDNDLVVYVPTKTGSGFDKVSLIPGQPHNDPRITLIDLSGAVTNTILKEEWFTLAIDLGGAVTDQAWARTGITFNEAATAFITNVRYYTCDAFMLGTVKLNAIGVPDELDPFTQFENDELIIIEGSPDYVTITEAEGAVDGIYGAYLYDVTEDDKAWDGRAIFHSTTPYVWGGTDFQWQANNMLIMENGWKYVVLNVYLTSDIPLVMLLPTVGTDNAIVHFPVGEAITDERVTVIDSFGTVTNKLVSEKWLTLAIRMDANAGASGVWSYTALTFGRAASLYYTNIRYYTNDDFLSGTLSYVQSTGDELVLATADAEYVSYTKQTGAIDGVSGAYLYSVTEADKAWDARATFYSTTPYSWGGTDDDWFANNELMAKRGWQYAVFKIRLTGVDPVIFMIPKLGPGMEIVHFVMNQKLTDSRVIVVDSSSERTDTLVKDEWLTMAVRIDAAAGEYWDWASLSVTSAFETDIYFADFRFYKNESFVGQSQ